jgi:ATP-binding cassette subfamily F protein uup
MNYLSVENIGKSFGERILFSDLSFGISKGEKIALVARNGSGKSTLLQLLKGSLAPDSGIITFRKDITVGFLEQEQEFDENSTPYKEILKIDTPAFKAYRFYLDSLNTPEDVDKSQKAFEQMQEAGAWELEAKIEEILFYLGLKEAWKQPISILSGGQKKRLALAKLLILNPDLVILDEPTNHLDLTMIEWLQGYLQKQSFALLMVTHDRYFLDSICNQILELENNILYKHKGNYSYYLEKKSEREENDAVNLGKAKQLFKKELEWMRRQPKARGTKSKARIDAFKDVKKVVKGQKKTGSLEMQIQMERLGSKILEIHHLKKAFDKKCIVEDFSYTFKKQDRVGIIGGNGVGKTTFLNMLMDIEPTSGGKIVKGETLKIGYYTQSGLQFKDDKRVIEVIKDIAEVIPLAKGRKMTAAQLLEKFLFPRDMHYNYVYKLSGGERKRLYLLTILMSNPNFLILDEPTNDLDILTLNVLEDFLEEFPGCLLIISHDRYFMDRLVDHLFVFEGEGKIQDFPGNYTDFRERQKEIKEEEKAKQKEKTEKEVATKEKKTNNRPQKLSYNQKKRLEEIEKNLDKLQTEKSELEKVFTATDLDEDTITKASKRLHEVTEETEMLELEWLEIQESVEG